MACSKYEYVKQYEQEHKCLLDTFIVVRIDGKGFTEFTRLHQFTKPNDLDALSLMNQAAIDTLYKFDDIVLAYGESDEYSFVFRKSAKLFNRRTDKIVSLVVSCFTASYVFNFQKMTGKELRSIPCFDGRVVLYPNEQVLKDYLSWRQVDCHINNQYNTCFWALIQNKGMSCQQAQKQLKGTLTEQKNEMLYEMGINYNTIQDIFKKGTVLIRQKVCDKKNELSEEQIQQIVEQKVQMDKEKYDDQQKVDKLYQKIKQQQTRAKQVIKTVHEDLINEQFWHKYDIQLQ